MQRMVEATLINNILNKYETRYQECQKKWNDDYIALASNKLDEDKTKFTLDDITSLNAQMGAYECIIKDLGDLIR